MGFRRHVFEQACRVVDKIHMEELLTAEDWTILREAWLCSKRGNILIDALYQQCWSREMVPWIVSHQNFLTQYEKWCTNRSRKRVLEIFRGCREEELLAVTKGKDEFGCSWTLSSEVAAFFARCCHEDGVVVKAHVTGIDAWLDTPENEIIHTAVGAENLVEAVRIEKDWNKKMDWENRPRIRPLDNRVNSHRAIFLG